MIGERGIVTATCPSIPLEVSGCYIHGVWWEDTSFPAPSVDLSGGLGFKPWDQQNNSWQKIQLLTWRDDPHAYANFPFFLPSNITCFVLPRTFLPLLPSSYWILSKLHVLPTDLPIILFLSCTHKTSLGNILIRACFALAQIIIPKNSICKYSVSFALILLWSFGLEVR